MWPGQEQGPLQQPPPGSLLAVAPGHPLELGGTHGSRREGTVVRCGSLPTIHSSLHAPSVLRAGKYGRHGHPPRTRSWKVAGMLGY